MAAPMTIGATIAIAVRNLVNAHSAPVTAGVFMPNGRAVIAGASDGTVRSWELASRLGRIVVRESGPVADVAVSADGALLAAAPSGTSHAFAVWRTSARPSTFAGHRDAVTSVEFSPDGKRLVTASFDHDVLSRDVGTGSRTKSLIGHVAVVRGAAFSADGRWVVTAGPTRAGVWEAGKSGLLDSRLTFLGGHRGAIRAAAFSPVGWRVYSGGADGTLRRYDCRLCAGTDTLRRIAAAKLERLTRDARR